MIEPAVYRNPRYEFRLAQLETGIADLVDSMNQLGRALMALKFYLESMQEQLPGERQQQWRSEKSH